MAEIPELVYRSAEKTLQEFCSQPLFRSGHQHLVLMEPCGEGFELLVSRFDHDRQIPLARLLYCVELQQWALHRPREAGRWSYVPEAGGTLDVGRLLRYLEHDPLNIFWLGFP